MINQVMMRSFVYILGSNTKYINQWSVKRTLLTSSPTLQCLEAVCDCSSLDKGLGRLPHQLLEDWFTHWKTGLL